MKKCNMGMYQWIAAALLQVAILKICGLQAQSHFLTWTFDSDGTTSVRHFTKEHFTEFYECLCMQTAQYCGISKDNGNSFTSTSSIMLENLNGSTKLDSTKYECELTNTSFTCSKLNVTDSQCSNTQQCITYSLKTVSNNDTICDLPFVKLLPTSNTNISVAYDSDFFNYFTFEPCAIGCQSETQPPPPLSTTAYSTVNKNFSSPSSSISISSSDMTNEQVVIIALAVSFAILIVALIILGVIVWRRCQKPRDNIMSNDVTAHTFTNHNNGFVNNGGNYASSDDNILPYSTLKASTALEMGVKDTKNQYETVDLDPDPEQRILTRSSIESKNGSSIKSSDSKKRALPAVLESPYSEPETTHVTGPYSTVDLDDAVGNVTITSDKPENASSPKLPETRSQGIPLASENPYSEPESKNLTDPYTRINPNTKSQKKKNIPNPPGKVTDDAGGKVSVSATPGDENDVRNDDSENAYSKLHETQRHFQNPYSVLSDPFTDTLDEPPANLPSSNVDIAPETATSTPAMDLPVLKDVVSDTGDKAIDDDDDAISEPDRSECDSDKNDENRKPDVAMHVPDNEEIKVQTDKDILEYTGPAENKTSASISSPTETGTAKKNEYFQLESDTESSTEEED